MFTKEIQAYVYGYVYGQILKLRDAPQKHIDKRCKYINSFLNELPNSPEKVELERLMIDILNSIRP